MNIKNSFFIVTLALFWVIQSNAQTGQEFGSQSGIHEYYDNNWSIGGGFNIVDDSDQQLGGIIDPGKFWNFSRPFYINAEYYLNNKFSFTGMLSMNKYKADKQIDLLYILEGHEASYFAFDLAAKLYFRDWLQSYKFDPYVFAGFGYTNIGEYQGVPVDKYQPDQSIVMVPSVGRLTFNAGVGFNVWFSQAWGLNLNLAGKWGIATGDQKKGANEDISNQLQYALGFVYFLGN